MNLWPISHLSPLARVRCHQWQPARAALVRHMREAHERHLPGTSQVPVALDICHPDASMVTSRCHQGARWYKICATKCKLGARYEALYICHPGASGEPSRCQVQQCQKRTKSHMYMILFPFKGKSNTGDDWYIQVGRPVPLYSKISINTYYEPAEFHKSYP